ncbi:RBBP9/YdeN family alpha/beta hydrolase [Mycoplana rhizolycopersici]|uniref:Serine hydrolase family protein n=1 Tax=Mycoplana rhizolycopersici TaxID=2746702 RepID=A0ABX2QM22_9HYPH|nr:alpha/beta fold hydrolase [Rhizobium rhizolycopersici]NVP57391.1 serine hydrolase family protein [Rhizobium rhizolycopersici]
MPSTDFAVDTLILPGLYGSPAAHWQRHWARDNPDSRVLEQSDWQCPDRQSWLTRLEQEIDTIGNDVWLVGHSLGCILAANLAESRLASRIRGALLVAPCDLDATETLHPSIIKFGAMPTARLPFLSLIIGSLNDPYMPVDRLRRTARNWGGHLLDIGNAGHINIASGFGRWTDGYDFLDRLKSSAGREAFSTGNGTRFFSAAVANTCLTI